MSDPTATEVADVLDAAAEVIERDGWCQNRLRTNDGRVCLVGAVDRVARERSTGSHGWWDVPSCKAAVEAMFKSLNREPKDFNDDTGRTKFEVIDALRHCAKDLRNEASA